MIKSVLFYETSKEEAKQENIVSFCYKFYMNDIIE